MHRLFHFWCLLFIHLKNLTYFVLSNQMRAGSTTKDRGERVNQVCVRHRVSQVTI